MRGIGKHFKATSRINDPNMRQLALSPRSVQSISPPQLCQKKKKKGGAGSWHRVKKKILLLHSPLALEVLGRIRASPSVYGRPPLCAEMKSRVIEERPASRSFNLTVRGVKKSANATGGQMSRGMGVGGGLKKQNKTKKCHLSIAAVSAVITKRAARAKTKHSSATFERGNKQWLSKHTPRSARTRKSAAPQKEPQPPPPLLQPRIPAPCSVPPPPPPPQ